MNSDSITDIAIGSNGCKYFTTAYSFGMQEPSHIEICSNKNIEMNVESYHEYPVACISISSHRIGDLCEPFSVVFIASADNITSWLWSVKKETYQLVCQCQVKSDYQKPIGLVLSPCETAIGIMKETKISILTVSSNFQISYWSSLELQMQSKSSTSKLTTILFISEFSTLFPLLLFSSYENGIIYVWNVQDCEIVCSFDLASTSNSTKHAISCAAHTTPRQNQQLLSANLVAFGTNDGEVLIYQFGTHQNEIDMFYCCPMLDVDLGKNILPMAIDFFTQDKNVQRSLRFPYCAVATQFSCVIVDCNSGSLVDSEKEKEQCCHQIVASRASIAFPYVLYSSAFSPTIQSEIVRIKNQTGKGPIPCKIQVQGGESISHFPFSKESNIEEFDSEKRLLSTKALTGAAEDIPEWSPLNLTFQYSANLTEHDKASKSKSKNKNKCRSFTKPMKKTVKSSGYAVYNPKIQLGQGPSTAIKEGKMRKSKWSDLKRERERNLSVVEYPMKCALIFSHQAQHDDVRDFNLPPIDAIEFNPNATSVAISYHNSDLQIFKLPFSKVGCPSQQLNTCITIENKEEVLRSTMSWSSSGKLIAMGNNVYDVSMSSKVGASCPPKSLSFEKSNTNPKFFYRDKFILTTNKSTLHLNEVFFPKINKRMKENTRWDASCMAKTKIAHSWSHEQAKHITSYDALNLSLSHLICTATSDKKLRIHDACTGGTVWSVPFAAGKRAAHSVSFPRINSHNIQVLEDIIPSASIDLVAAASTDGGGLLSLWDIRSASSAGIFRGHVNKRETCRTTFSPCLRYIAIGSEDYGSGAVIYDLRKTGKGEGIVAKLPNMNANRGAIVEVKYNPLYPQLITGSLGGKLKFYDSNSV